MPAVKPCGLTSKRTAGTRDEAASLSPFTGKADSQEPPDNVEDFTLQSICPWPVFKMLKNCGVVGPPPCTAKNVNPVCGMSMLCGTADTVMFTGMMTLCAGFTLDAVTTPEYTPGWRPVGSAVMFTLVEAKAPSDKLAMEALSHGPP